MFDCPLGLVTDKDTGVKMMVVAGGLANTDEYNINSTEILIDGKWQKGKQHFPLFFCLSDYLPIFSQI